MSRWYPHDKVKYLVTQVGKPIRGIPTSELWDDSKFYDGKKNFGMSGITFSRKKINFSKELIESDNHKLQASIIYHELVHVAQQKKMGWMNFMATYLGQWMRAGCRYENMMEKGLENEAYGKQEMFDDKIRYL